MLYAARKEEDIYIEEDRKIEVRKRLIRDLIYAMASPDHSCGNQDCFCVSRYACVRNVFFMVFTVCVRLSTWKL